MQNKVFKNFAGIIAAILGYILVKYIVFAPQQFEAVLNKTAQKVNEKCPMMVDSETRLDNAVILPEKIIMYNYTLVNVSKASFSINAAKQYMTTRLVNNVKTNPDLKVFRDNKVSMHYSYKDKNGTHLFNIEINPSHYQ